MKVFDADDEWRLLRNPSEQLADDLERPPLERLRRELLRAHFGFPLEREIEQRSEVRVELIGPTCEQLLESPAQPDADAQLRLVGAGADPVGAEKIA
jgi:hypothetical protein